MEETKIVNGEIVTTTKVDLASHIEAKKRELEIFGQDLVIKQKEVEDLQNRQSNQWSRYL